MKRLRMEIARLFMLLGLITQEKCVETLCLFHNNKLWSVTCECRKHAFIQTPASKILDFHVFQEKRNIVECII